MWISQLGQSDVLVCLFGQSRSCYLSLIVARSHRPSFVLLDSVIVGVVCVEGVCLYQFSRPSKNVLPYTGTPTVSKVTTSSSTCKAKKKILLQGVKMYNRWYKKKKITKFMS